MNDRHEQSRAAFEAEAESELNSTMKDSHGQYIAAVTSVMWQAWCRALDYAAEQQAKQPEPLTRPDRPGWWWVWAPAYCFVDSKARWTARYYREHDFHTIDANGENLWLPATPPPAPTQEGSND